LKTFTDDADQSNPSRGSIYEELRCKEISYVIGRVKQQI